MPLRKVPSSHRVFEPHGCCQRSGFSSLGGAGTSLAVVPLAHHVCPESSICRNISSSGSGKTPWRGNRVRFVGRSRRSNPIRPTAKPGPALNLRRPVPVPNIAAASSSCDDLIPQPTTRRKRYQTTKRTDEPHAAYRRSAPASRAETPRAGPT